MNAPNESVMVLAVVDVAGFAKACRGRPDAEIFAALDGFYRRAAEAVAPAGGRVVKAMGDGVFLVFPKERAAEAVGCLRAFCSSEAGSWRRFDARCGVKFHAHLARVASGPIGPEGRFDVIGHGVNALFLMARDGEELSGELARQVGE